MKISIIENLIEIPRLNKNLNKIWFFFLDKNYFGKCLKKENLKSLYIYE